MAKCAKCNHDVVRVTYGPTTIDLDPIPRTWVAVEEHHIFPEDDDRVFLSTSLVEHSAVCPALRKEQALARETGRQQYQGRHAHKKEGKS